jgi:hypothetical protein
VIGLMSLAHGARQKRIKSTRAVVDELMVPLRQKIHKQ